MYIAQNILIKNIILTVPTPSVTVTASSNQIVNQLLTLECNVTTVRGITSRVDIVWSSDGTELERVEGVNISSMTSSTAVYTDTYTISLLTTSDDDKVYQCEVVINSNTTVATNNTIALDVTGEYCLQYQHINDILYPIFLTINPYRYSFFIDTPFLWNTIPLRILQPNAFQTAFHPFLFVYSAPRYVLGKM